MSNQPFLPLFFGDLLASTPTWDGEERALYMLLLAYQWSSGPLPADSKRLAKMCQYEVRTFSKLWEVVGKKFVGAEGGLINLRLEQHREKAKAVSKKRAQAGLDGAAKRWQKPPNDDGNGMANAIANAIDLSSHPSHPIPISSDSDPSDLADAADSDAETTIDKALYADARKVFGKSIGGQVNKAIKFKGKPWLVSVIESCRTKDQEAAKAYFAAALNGAASPNEAQQRRVVP